MDRFKSSVTFEKIEINPFSVFYFDRGGGAGGGGGGIEISVTDS